MKRLFLICSLAVAACATNVLLPRQALAAVSDEDFNALKNMVQELNQKFEKLQQVHEQDQQTHQQDQKEIQQLRQQLDQTQQLATNAVQKAEAAARVQPVAPALQGPSATHQFQLAGDAETVFGAVHGQSGAFAFADFAPIFLYRANDNVLFEAGFDFFLANSAPAALGTAYGWDLSFATLDYLLNDYVTVEVGNMLLPLGTYSERSAGWLNKFPDNPLPRGLLPGSGIGVQLRGAVPIGDNGQLLTYSAYGVNGPSSFDGSGTAASLDLNGNVGVLSAASSLPRRYGYGLPGTPQAGTTFSTVGNLNPDPSGGGRIGWFYPWKPHYDVELGLSGQSGPWDPQGGQWSALVLDAAMHVSPCLEVKGEYIDTWMDTTDLGSIRPNGWWVQGGYKLAGLNLDWPLINNVELVGRYDQSKDGLVPVTNAERYTAGFVYYFSSTLLFEGDYEWLHSSGPSSGYFPANELLFQVSYGF